MSLYINFFYTLFAKLGLHYYTVKLIFLHFSHSKIQNNEVLFDISITSKGHCTNPCTYFADTSLQGLPTRRLLTIVKINKNM